MRIDSVQLSSTDQALLEKTHSFLCGSIQSLPQFKVVEQKEDLKDLQRVADRFRFSFDDVVILGTGGSSLGAKTLCSLQAASTPQLHFMDNVDPHTFEVLFNKVVPQKTGFLVISKSGRTAETLSQFLTCLGRWEKALGHDKLKDHFLLISEPTDNKLCQLGKKYDLPCLDHPPDIGGRFSCLTLVGILPAMIAGLEGLKVREGAQRYLKECLERKDCAPALGAIHAFSNEKSHSSHVIMPYIDRLAAFGMWYRQLWAESLGKEGRGLTPIRAMGTVDQHSQLQLYLDGPKDKTFTVIILDTEGQGDVLRNTTIDYLEKHTLGDLLAAEAKATIETLRQRGCPVRTILLDKLDEKVLGALFMHYMLETVLTAHLMAIDAFNQPAVEQGKILTKEYLAA